MVVAALGGGKVVVAQTTREAGTERFLAAVREYADNVLRHGRDVYGPRRTPLFVDGLNVDTFEPVIWVLPDEHAAVWEMPKRAVLSNLASQQILFRVLDALTTLTGDPQYRQAAIDALRYGLEHLQYKDGLLFWGGHTAVDLESDRIIGEGNKNWATETPIPATWETGVVHELKCHFPYYDLMWKVDPAATRRFIEAFWACHILCWDRLEMNRHGVYGRHAGEPWSEAYVGGPVPFVSKGMPFMLTGSDLYYAAALLYGYTGEQGPLLWAKRLLRRYDETRHPATGLAADMYSIHTSHRHEKQFGPEFGDRVTDASLVNFQSPRYTQAAICRLQLSERLGAAAEEFKTSALADLRAWARHCYDPSDNRYWVMLTDGTKLLPSDIKRPGYATEDQLGKHSAGGLHLWAYAIAYRLTGDPALWQMVSRIAAGAGLGDLGEAPGEPGRPNLRTASRDVYAIFALLELGAATHRRDYVALAERIGDNLLADQFHRGFFLPSRNHVYAEFDSVTPLALLYVYAARVDCDVKLPLYTGGRSYFHCDFEGRGRTYDGAVIYAQTRKP